MPENKKCHEVAGFGAFFYFPSTTAFTASIRSTVRLLGTGATDLPSTVARHVLPSYL